MIESLIPKLVGGVAQVDCPLAGNAIPLGGDEGGVVTNEAMSISDGGGRRVSISDRGDRRVSISDGGEMGVIGDGGGIVRETISDGGEMGVTGDRGVCAPVWSMHNAQTNVCKP